MPSSTMVHWGEKSIDHVTTGSKVQLTDRTQVSWHLGQQGSLWPGVFKTLHNLHINPASGGCSLFTKFSHFSFSFIFVPLSRQWYWLTNPSIFLFFLFLHILVVGVHLSEWNTEGKLGQYSLQLRQKQLSFKSPPHPHFPGVCAIENLPRTNAAAPPQPAAVCLRYVQLSLASLQC